MTGVQTCALPISLSTDELKNPKSTISNSKPILKDTKHWYINLNEFEDFIRDWITKEHKDDWKPNVTGQVKSWLDNGLKSRAVTRDLDWGIPINVEGEEGKVLYVWFEDRKSTRLNSSHKPISYAVFCLKKKRQ